MPLPFARVLVSGFVVATAFAAACSDSSQKPPVAPATPAGYWEGKVKSSETPLKDHVRTLTRTVMAEIWFTVQWDRARDVGVAVGEADAVYTAVLKVENLPTLTAPVPGGSIKFEPEVGGTLTETDNRRRYPIVGVLSIDAATGKGTLILQKAEVASGGTERERLDNEARGAKGPDAPMDFTIRGDPGVSGGFAGAKGSIRYKGGKVSGGSGGAEVSAKAGSSDASVVIVVPMTPFSPFANAPGQVEKRPGGPYAASFEEKAAKHSIVWTAKQAGGENREPLRLTPEMQHQIDALIASLGRGR